MKKKLYFGYIVLICVVYGIHRLVTIPRLVVWVGIGLGIVLAVGLFPNMPMLNSDISSIRDLEQRQETTRPAITGIETLLIALPLIFLLILLTNFS